ncbi:hypothetical protein K450DRAFT_230230 [Umbelopsis ramanniana AG]|uniref:WHIM1 domain-containing protein n=1 Tax=Umbelopsis ramanniana AG TaxID=1314678 RepID=A0AAD5HGD2_UMBRA|nr:uncharacterized protein K450DRAFT_230230 [Umbelopsis ramanniana AG]KAI8581984.1 hypothetical protein K450DRAFT_230230 [Umbelopsis ramanniana AG]
MPSLRQLKRASSSESSHKDLKKPRRESSRSKLKIPEPKAVIQPSLSPEQILQSSWKFLEFAQFCLTFKIHLGLPPLTIDSLESMLLNNEATQNSEDGDSVNSENTPDNNDGLSSIYSNEHTSKLEDLVLPLFQNLSHPKRLPSIFDIGDSLLRLHKWHNLSLDGVKSSKPTANNFYQLTMDEKVDILYTLMENVMDNPGSEIGELCRSGDLEFKRYESIGTDTEGRSYWMFGSERLYREAPLSSVKRKVPTLPNRPHTYELVCQYPDDWRTFLKEISSKRKGGKVFPPDLVEELKVRGEGVIENHEQKERAILRREEKLHRAIMRAKAFENMPRKRSSRLEQKKQEREEITKLEEEIDSLEDIEAVRQYVAQEQSPLEDSKIDTADEIETV